MKIKFSKFSNLFERTNYLSPVNSIVNRVIEYDIRSAGFNICRKYKLLDDKTIETLSELDKESRNIQIGLLRRKNNELSKRMAEYIGLEKLEFFRLNSVQDSDILSIKNDAIFLIGIKAKKRKFGLIEFVEKNKYTSFLKIENIEFYYNRAEDKLDVKGISDNILDDHLYGMIRFISDLMRLIEDGDITRVKKFLVKFSREYKRRELSEVYYRTFNGSNGFEYDEETGEIDIRYNYMAYILPLLQRYMF